MSAASGRAEVQPLIDLWLAGCSAYNCKDIDGWMKSAHPQLNSFQGNRFQTLAEGMAKAPAVLEVSDRFETTWVEGTVVGGSAVLWGECEFDVRLDDGPATTFPLAFSAYYTRVDDAWCALFTHYTPLTTLPDV